MERISASEFSDNCKKLVILISENKNWSYWTARTLPKTKINKEKEKRKERKKIYIMNYPP